MVTKQSPTSAATIEALTFFDRRAIPDQAGETIWHARDGWPIRRIDWHGACVASSRLRGSILFLPGRGDYYEKYLETLHYYAQQNWHVTAIDWRGQSLSGRIADDPSVGDIDDFGTWVADLETFYAAWTAERAGPHIVLAHSMGGHLAMRAVIEKVIMPDALILAAPMLSIHSGGLPLAITRIVARLMVMLGRAKKAAWKISEKPLSPLVSRSKMLTHDQVRYEDEEAWWSIRPGIKLGPGSWRWVDRAVASIRKIHQLGTFESVKIPVLIIATSADQLVSTDQIIQDEKRLPNAELLLFGKEAAHELLREADVVRDKVISAIDAFLERIAPAV
jgi:lysophospholipase